MTTRQYKTGARITVYRPNGDAFFETAGQDAIVIDCGWSGVDTRTGFRCAFTIEKSLGKNPNKCDLTISNLAPATRAAIARNPTSVVLAAGYDGVFKRVFYGDVRWCDSLHEDATWNTTVLLGDGDRAFRHGRVNRSYRAGARVSDAIKDAAAAMGLTPPAEISASEDLATQFAAGDTIVGPARDELTRLLAPYGYTWSIQDGRLVVLREDQVRPGEAWPVDISNGLKGSPEVSPPERLTRKSGKASKKDKGSQLTVRTTLYPEISPGGTIRLRSERISGDFRVEAVRHSGDTEGDEWTTEIQCRARSASGASATL